MTLAKKLHDLYIQFEIAEKDGRPVIELAYQINDLREAISALRKPEPAEPELSPEEAAELRRWFWKPLTAILQPPAPRREDDGDLLYA